MLITRKIRILNYFHELKDFEMIVATFKKFSVPFASMMLTLYTVMFVYSVVGIYAFNGKITRSAVALVEADVDYMYIMMSFNDFTAAMITLFHIIVENNWNTTTAMYTEVIGNNWARVYFVSYWLITDMIMLNIIISFVLEIYTTVGEDIEEKHVKLMYGKQLMDMFKDDDDFKEYLKSVLQIGFMGNYNRDSVLQPSRHSVSRNTKSDLRASGSSKRSRKLSGVSAPLRD